MSRLQHLVAATDLSEPARHAVDRAWQLAHAAQARITLVHALGLETVSPIRTWLASHYDELTARLRADAVQSLAAVVQAQTDAPAVSPETVVLDGLAGWVVPDYARAHGADLLVAATRGSSGFKRWILGSTASKLLRKTHCPVLLVKNPAQQAYRRVLVAVDFSAASARSVQLARAIAPEADLVLLHVYEMPFLGKMQFAGVSPELIRQYQREAHERGVQQLTALADAAGLSPKDYSALVLEGDAADLVLQHQELHQCDLIVMGKHGTHVTEELLLGSVTQRVLDQTLADMLVVVDPLGPDMSSMGA